MNLILTACVIIFLSGALFGVYIYRLLEKKENKYIYKNYCHADRIVACFKDVDWTEYTFTVNNGFQFTDNYGNKKFYSSQSIKSAIEKMNQEISDSR